MCEVEHAAIVGKSMNTHEAIHSIGEPSAFRFLFPKANRAQQWAATVRHFYRKDDDDMTTKTNDNEVPALKTPAQVRDYLNTVMGKAAAGLIPVQTAQAISALSKAMLAAIEAEQKAEARQAKSATA